MFNLIKQNVNIVRHIEKYVELHQSGRTVRGKCPLHEEDTPSFHIYPDENSFFCFGCNRGGSVIDFEAYRQKITPIEAATFLCDEYNLHPSPADSFRFQQQIQIRKRKEEWLEALSGSFVERTDIFDYVKVNRGLSDDTIKEFQLGAGSNTNVVVIPINDKFGRVVGFARRNLDKDVKEKYVNDPTDMVYIKSEILYNLDRARKYVQEMNSIIMNEGYFDVMSLWEAGIKNGVAFCSSRITREQAGAVSGCINENSVVYFVPTNDETAQEQLERNSMQIKAQCPKNHQRILVVPSDCKDLNDVLLRYGREKIVEIYKNTVSIELYMVRRIIQTEPMIELQYVKIRNYCQKLDNAMVVDDICKYLVEHWKKPPDVIYSFLMTKSKNTVDVSQYKTMQVLIDDYDRYIETLKENRINFGWVKTDIATRGMRIGDVVQLVASSGVGKTLWAENLITNLVKNYPELPVVFFSLEQMGVMAFERFVMMEGQLESYQVEKWNKNEDSEVQVKIVSTLKMLEERYKNFALIDEGGMTLVKLENYVTHASMAVFDRPVKVIVIDYLGYLQGEGKDLYHKISVISKELKELAKKLKCAIVSLHQVSKAGKSGGSPIEAHMVRDSGVVTESADIMISAWRPELKEGIKESEKKDLEGVYKTKIVKNRYGVSGIEIDFMFVKKWLKLFEKREEFTPADSEGKIFG